MVCVIECQGITHWKHALMARHSVGAIMLVAGSLPSRALGMTVFIVQHLATCKKLQSLFRPSAYFAFVDFGNFRNRHSPLQHYRSCGRRVSLPLRGKTCWVVEIFSTNLMLSQCFYEKRQCFPTLYWVYIIIPNFRQRSLIQLFTFGLFHYWHSFLQLFFALFLQFWGRRVVQIGTTVGCPRQERTKRTWLSGLTSVVPRCAAIRPQNMCIREKSIV